MDSPLSAKLLVVDDNAAALYATARVLRSAGFQVVEASTGTAALEAAPQAELIVLDINLPDIDGFEICRRLRADPSTAHMPILHLSATFVQRQDRDVGLEAGADGFLTRPVEPLVLIATVRTLLFARRADQVRRRLAARLRGMFDLAPVAMGTVDSQLCFDGVNPAFCVLTGYEPHELIGASVNRLLELDHPTIAQALTMVNQHGQGARCSGTGPLRRKDASIAQVEWQMAHDEGAGMRILALTDITERLRADTEREALLGSERAARSEAERSNRLKEEFLATLSHELRTPLSAILGWSTVLNRMPDLPATVTQGVQAIERNSRLQAQMISDLLDYAGIAFGKMRLAMSIIDPYPVVRAALEVVQAAAQSAGVRLEAVLSDEAVHVEADASRLQQMVWNLLTNAIKFSARGGDVQVTATPVGEAFRITVTDHGQGIAPDFLPRIFERFSQQDASSTRRHGGLGLGLAIVKQLAELQGGSVQAYSAGEQQGSTFTLELPVSVKHPYGISLSESQLVRLLDLRDITVLLVEDDPDARQLARRILMDAGAQVLEAADAQQALQRVRADRPDVLVSDIGMAGQDGYELLRQIRSHGLGPERLPAIALTAFARAQDREEALAAGFQDYLVKPFDAQSLVLRVAAFRRLGAPER